MADDAIGPFEACQGVALEAGLDLRPEHSQWVGGRRQGRVEPRFQSPFGRQKLKWRNPGILAYEIGTFDLTLANEVGKSTPRRGKYVVVWKKQANGMWKAAADVFNTDQ